MTDVNSLPRLCGVELNARLAERFWAKVERGGPGDCWPWTASQSRKGYGQFKLLGKKTAQAHRVAFALAGKIVPDGLQLDHVCRVRRCCNPTHLEPVTSRENTLRGGHHPCASRGQDALPGGASVHAGQPHPE